MTIRADSKADLKITTTLTTMQTMTFPTLATKRHAPMNLGSGRLIFPLPDQLVV